MVSKILLIYGIIIDWQNFYHDSSTSAWSDDDDSIQEGGRTQRLIEKCCSGNSFS